MNRYQIITDSGCDLPLQMRQQLNIEMVSLTLNFKGQQMPDSVSDDIKQLPRLKVTFSAPKSAE